ncbi:MAG TPA: RidA family protein [Anaeromyxobacteraceae bacterium]|nr:RidA family protein [Anaeromyxobacteraceae bacterium]
MDVLQPPGWPRPRGYSNGIVARGRLVFVAGQVGCNAQQKFESGDLVGQARQALRNVLAVLAEAGAGPEHVCRMTWYLADRDEYLSRLADLGAAYREVMGRSFPAMTAIQVAGFVEPGARLEIEATAVVPE